MGKTGSVCQEINYNTKIIIQVFFSIIIISEVLKHVFYSAKMTNRSPFRCPKVLSVLFGGLSPFLSLVGPVCKR